jgi:hypothetical protein
MNLTTCLHLELRLISPLYTFTNSVAKHQEIKMWIVGTGVKTNILRIAFVLNIYSCFQDICMKIQV